MSVTRRLQRCLATKSFQSGWPEFSCFNAWLRSIRGNIRSKSYVSSALSFGYPPGTRTSNRAMRHFGKGLYWEFARTLSLSWTQLDLGRRREESLSEGGMLDWIFVGPILAGRRF